MTTPNPSDTSDTTTDASCACGSGRAYAQCCGPFHAGTTLPPTAEALMRSRYAAYVRADEPYLLASWHPRTRPGALRLAATRQPTWLGLTIVAANQADDVHATVEFIARYRAAGREQRLHELSRFERIDGRWYYVDGDFTR